MQPHLQPLFAAQLPIRVLDVGCGNGRFGLFLAETYGPATFHYTGLDNSPYLLDRAHQTLISQSVQHTLAEADIVSGVSIEGTYQVIALFGVMHHIPSAALRRQLVDQLASHLASDGILVISTWAFYELTRFRDRIVAWDTEQVPLEYRQLTDLEPHDYLLDWRSQETPALRYCHYVSHEEAITLFDGYRLLAQFDADTLNHYFILQTQ